MEMRNRSRQRLIEGRLKSRTQFIVTCIIVPFARGRSRRGGHNIMVEDFPALQRYDLARHHKRRHFSIKAGQQTFPPSRRVNAEKDHAIRSEPFPNSHRGVVSDAAGELETLLIRQWLDVASFDDPDP